MRRHRLIAVLAAVLSVALASPQRASAAPEPGAPPKWVQRIDDVVKGEPVSVEIAYGGQALYRHKDWVARPPASNEKLLLSLALLDRLSPSTTVPLRALTTRKPVDGVIEGDVWIVGHGDPETGPDDMRALAAAIAAKGVRRIRGHVYGATGPFARDWFAPGWKDYFPTYYIALPTALTFDGNVGPTGRHISDPERRAASSLTDAARARGDLRHEAARAGVAAHEAEGTGDGRLGPPRRDDAAYEHPLAELLRRGVRQAAGCAALGLTRDDREGRAGDRGLRRGARASTWWRTTRRACRTRTA